MNKRLPFSLMLAALVAAAFITPSAAQAQRYDAVPIISSLTVSNSTANTNAQCVIPCRFQKVVALQFVNQNDASGAVTLSFPYYRSVDGVTYETTASGTLGLSFNGTAKQCIVTNLETLGCGYIKIPYATNAHATITATNLSVYWGLKTQSP